MRARAPTTVSIAIPSLDRHDDLRSTLAALTKIDLDAVVEILVVDQTAVVFDAASLQAACRVPIRVVPLQRKGLCIARNEALRCATGDVLLYLDDDVVPGEALVREHLGVYRERPETIGVAGVEQRVAPTIDGPVKHVLRRLLWWGVGVYARRSPRYRKYLDSRGRPVGLVLRSGLFLCDFEGSEACPVLTPRGCNMSFLREALVGIGGFDEGYVGVARRDESDVSLRLLTAHPGRTLWFNPRARLLHLESTSGGSGFRGQRTRSWYESLLTCEMLFARKHLGASGRAITRLRLVGLHMRALVQHPSLWALLR